MFVRSAVPLLLVLSACGEDARRALPSAGDAGDGAGGENVGDDGGDGQGGDGGAGQGDEGEGEVDPGGEGEGEPGPGEEGEGEEGEGEEGEGEEGEGEEGEGEEGEGEEGEGEEGEGEEGEGEEGEGEEGEGEEGEGEEGEGEEGEGEEGEGEEGEGEEGEGEEGEGEEGEGEEGEGEEGEGEEGEGEEGEGEEGEGEEGEGEEGEGEEGEGEEGEGEEGEGEEGEGEGEVDPVGQGCVGLLDCLQECEGDRACERACEDAVDEAVLADYDGWLNCTEEAGDCEAGDLICLRRSCPDEARRCLRPPGCVEVVTCSMGCAGERACERDCERAADDEALEVFDIWVGCAEGSGCDAADVPCLRVACAQLSAECLPGPDCLEGLACAVGCEDDAACLAGCFASLDAEVEDQLAGLVGCMEGVECGPDNLRCAYRHCAEEALACGVEPPEDVGPICPDRRAPGDAGPVFDCADADGDGYGVGEDCLGDDCDDGDAAVRPDRFDACDGEIDDDCSGDVDDDPHCAVECDRGEATGNFGSPCEADEECGSGVCRFGFCMGFCEADADCDNPDPGPFQGDWFCMGDVDNLALCMPGSQAACTSDADCREGEACAFSFADDFQEFELRCRPHEQCAVGYGEQCNADPEVGPVRECDAGSCFRGYCDSFCDDDADCAGNPWRTCQEFDFGLAQLTSVCSGAPCESNADCAELDPEATCALSLNQGELVGLCARSRPQGAAPGEECDGSGSCQRGLCYFGRCADGCVNDDECGPHGFCEHTDLCNRRDPDTDECLELTPHGICRVWPGSGAECAVDLECPQGEHCTRRFSAPAGQEDLTLRTVCRQDGDGADHGEECGGEDEIDCARGECVAPRGGDGPRTCQPLCSCPADCQGGRVCQGDIEEQDGGDLTWAFCEEAPGSLQNCEGDAHGCPDGEHCSASVLYHQVAATWQCEQSDGAGVDGDLCAAGRADCAGAFCINDPDDLFDAPYCSRICFTPDDCEPGWECAPQPHLLDAGDIRSIVTFCIQP